MEKFEIDNFNEYQNSHYVLYNQDEFTANESQCNWIKSVCWFNDGTKLELKIYNGAYFYPFFRLNRFLMLYINDPNFIPPDNMIIYNSDGSIFKKVPVPHFNHPQTKDEIQKYLKPNKMKGTDVHPSFYSIGTLEDIERKKYLTIHITEPVIFKYSHYYEERALDIESGEWHPSWSIFHSPLGNQGWGESFK